VGAALGTSDDAAQKRVTRAVDQLRTFFLRRGVAVSATGFATTLSAHALTTVPPGLSATISTATTLSAVAAAEGTRVILMTTFQKSLVAAAFVVLGGGAFYQANLIAAQSSEIDRLTARRSHSAAELRQLNSTHAALAARLKDVERSIDTRLTLSLPLSPADAALQTQMQEWLAELNRLKDIFKQRPDLRIPELSVLSDEDWFKTVSTSEKLETEEAVCDVAAKIRRSAEDLFMPQLSDALKAYIKAHGDQLPTTMQDLAPYLSPSLDPAALDRYEPLRQGRLADVPDKDRMKLLGLKAPVDLERDAYWFVGYGYGNTPAKSFNQMKARDAYAAAHSGQRPPSGTDLTDYLPWPTAPKTPATNAPAPK
jgi:hypothetical protein